jgi:hypothetical protein
MLVAIAVAGIVLLIAGQLARTVGDSAVRLQRVSRQEAEAAHVDDLARSILASIDMAGPEGGALTGTERGCRFRTRCPVSGGWLEPCSATLSIVSDSTGARVVLATSSGLRLTLMRTGRAGLRYLDSAEGGGRWLPEWTSSRTAPLAIGIVTGDDTTLLRVGAGG